ncbi:hypothetical protein ACFVW2_00100 [Streptomyces sp. NPDC058171]
MPRTRGARVAKTRGGVMPARTHTRPSSPASTGGVEVRLPWWAVLLPAVAFVVLFVLLLNPAEAHAAPAYPEIGLFVERARQVLAF